ATQQPAAYRAALALYTGDLLPEDQYEDWVHGRREELRATCLTLLGELARLHEAAGDFEPAIETLQRATALDPLYEPAHAGLLRLYARTGQRARALRQYQQLQERLRADLDVEPSAELQRLYAEIMAGRWEPAAAPAAPAASAPPAGRPDLPVP